MKLFRKLVGAASVVISVNALAGPAFEISGLHIGLVFTEAMEQAEKLGGVCQLNTSRRKDGGIRAQCEYLPCVEGNSEGACDGQNLEPPALTIASQPIVRIGLEAPGVSSSLTRIAILFEGSTAAVAESLKREFGQPINDTSATTEGSWSHSRRLHWKQGKDHMGLLDTVKVIMLTTDPVQQELDRE